MKKHILQFSTIIAIFSLFAITCKRNTEYVTVQTMKVVKCDILYNNYEYFCYVAWKIMKKIHIIIERYRTKKGKIPDTSHKSNMSFVLPLIETKDSIDNLGGYFTAYENGRRVLNIDKGILYDSIVCGSGSSLSPIYYVRIDDERYILYWVGCNGVDENGSGDDIVYVRPSTTLGEGN